MVNIIAVVLALAALVASLANAGYLGLLGSAANKRAGGGEISTYVKSRLPIAAGATVAALVALLFSRGGAFLDVLAILLALGSGGVAISALQGVRTHFASR
ncbi:MAG: hypothetical protein M3Y49_17955 [Actinomycetota bacterium]|nr:hypothetical protein [Actinomycetota bacterium]